MYFKGMIKQPGEVFIVPNTFFNGAWTLGTVSPYFIAIQKARMAAAHIYAKIDRVCFLLILNLFKLTNVFRSQ